MEAFLRKRIGREIFDYQTLLDAISDYRSPRSKITSLLRKGVIVRVKKGLYVFGEGYRLGPFSSELLANLIYGPSFVSLDYALHMHGVIPEKVTVVTSSTTKRQRRFVTPVGIFSYRAVPRRGFHIGVLRIEGGPTAYLVATPERALADKLRDDRRGSVRSMKAMRDYLFEDIRIDDEAFSRLDATLFGAIVEATGCRKGEQALKLLRSMQGGRS